MEPKGEALVLDTAALDAVPLNLCKRPVVNLHVHQGDIPPALDTLFGAL